MSIGGTAAFKCKVNQAQALEAAFRDLAEQVRLYEPGNRIYRPFKSCTDANAYIMMEILDDQAALDAHNASDHLKAAGSKFSSLVDGPADIRYFDAV